MAVKRKVDVDMLNAVKSVLADVSSVSPLSSFTGTAPNSGAVEMIAKSKGIH